MATQKEMKEMREDILAQLNDKIDFDNFEQIGQITDGMLYFNKATDGYLVLKPIAKKEGFDVDDALQEFEDKEKARIEREQAKAQKVSKAKAEKEKEED